MTGHNSYDLLVIGAGSGGVRAARIAASHGLRTAIAESGPLGGTCVNAGCVPKKLLVYASEFENHFHDAAGFGWTLPSPPAFDWRTLVAAKDREIARLNGIYAKLLTDSGVTLYKGRARFTGPHDVAIGNQTVTADTILIAAGGTPRRPAVQGAEHLQTSDDMFHLPALPDRIAIIGGGYIAVEFAGIFAGLGANVTLLHRGPSLLSGFDTDIGAAVADEMRNIPRLDLRLQSPLARIEKRGTELEIHTADGSVIACDAALAATGRIPATKDLALDKAGLAADPDGRIPVDAQGRTAVPHIHAVGDICNRHNLTPVAIAEGHAFADRLAGLPGRMVDERFIPTAIFSRPPAASVGMAEQAARAQGIDIDIYRTRFRPMKHALGGRNTGTMMKLVVEKSGGRILGFHMVGDDAPEIIQMAAPLLQKGITKSELDETIALHPTAAEEFVTMRKPVGP